MADYIKQIKIGTTSYDIKAAADASGNIIADTYVKKSGDTMIGNLTTSNEIHFRYDTAKGTNPSSDTSRRIVFLDNSGTEDADRVGLIENVWKSGGNTSLLLRAYSSANAANFIGVTCHYPTSGDPYVQVTGCANVNNVVRNIRTGTSKPSDSTGSNGELFVVYIA